MRSCEHFVISHHVNNTHFHFVGTVMHKHVNEKMIYHALLKRLRLAKYGGPLKRSSHMTLEKIVSLNKTFYRIYITF